MPAPTYQEAVTVTDATTLQSQLTTDLAAEGVVLTGFSPTSAERGLIALDARALSTEQQLRAEVVKSGLLVDVEFRDEEWVDRKVYGFFRVERLRETKARHVFTLTNQSATGGPYTINPLSREAMSLDGTKFKNLTGGTLRAGVGETLQLEFEALVAGLSGNIGPGEIYKLLGGTLPAVDITNILGSQIFVARRRETNREYLERALARWGTLAAGGHEFSTRFRILSGVETIAKLGVRDDNPNGPGSVDVFLANAAGPATTQECAAAQAVFGPYEPLGSRGLWRYLPAVARNVAVTGTMEPDGTSATIIADATATLALLAAQWPMEPGRKLDNTLVHGIVRGLASEEYAIPGFRGVSDLDMTAPLDDTVLDVGEVLIFTVSLTEV